ncbi:P-loop NTPase fold protein [Olivibacter jilunii]|uniref:P-loop NTPase fold protein n=1 Tax=Olivibacter jilunii TaxID=985016 RepID=UPI003F5CCE9D
MNTHHTDIKVEYSKIEDYFLDHLLDERNTRILFSAPFGSGKSTFIRDFFEKDSNRHFVSINLYPVNYAVANNEDVFELIKFDILSEIIAKYGNKDLPIFKKDEFSLALKAQVFALQTNAGMDFLKSMISAFSKTGKSLFEVLEMLKAQGRDFKEFENDVEPDVKKSIEEYLESFNRRPGVLEMDDVSHLINQALIDIKKYHLVKFDKENNNPKTESDINTILIIDDLDRLEPDQVFRLFNVFSAHYDAMTEQNKFGFDKVVFICDYQNIKRMFANKYGQNVDFNGYLNKFYSTQPFAFDSKKYLISKVDDFINAKPWNTSESIASHFGRGTTFRAVLKWTLYSLIDLEELTIRTLDRSSPFTLSAEETLPLTPDSRNHQAITFDFYVLIRFLQTLFDLGTLNQKMQVLSQKLGAEYKRKELEWEYRVDNVQRAVAEWCLVFLLPSEKVFNDDLLRYGTQTENDFFQNPVQDNCYFEYYLRSTDDGGRRWNQPNVIGAFTEPKEDTVRAKIDVFKLLHFTLQQCIQKGVIN